jgi:hypothetical protein
VVITNASNQPLRLWNEWCSWGYFNLSFQVTDENGKTGTVKKTSPIFEPNVPSWSVLQPGDHQVIEVSFDPRTWLDPVLPEARKYREVKMMAVFEVPEDKETKENNILAFSSSRRTCNSMWYT